MARPRGYAKVVRPEIAAAQVRHMCRRRGRREVACHTGRSLGRPQSAPTGSQQALTGLRLFKLGARTRVPGIVSRACGIWSARMAAASSRMALVPRTRRRSRSTRHRRFCTPRHTRREVAGALGIGPRCPALRSGRLRGRGGTEWAAVESAVRLARTGHLLYANVMATLAVFIALGGVGFAAATLPRNSVGTVQLKANAVTGAKIRSGAVTGSDVRNGSLAAADFRGGLPAGPAGAPGPPGAPGAGRARSARRAGPDRPERRLWERDDLRQPHDPAGHPVGDRRLGSGGQLRHQRRGRGRER